MPIRPRRETEWRIGFFMRWEERRSCSRGRLSGELLELIDRTKASSQDMRYVSIAITIGEGALGFHTAKKDVCARGA